MPKQPLRNVSQDFEKNVHNSNKKLPILSMKTSPNKMPSPKKNSPTTPKSLKQTSSSELTDLTLTEKPTQNLTEKSSKKRFPKNSSHHTSQHASSTTKKLPTQVSSQIPSRNAFSPKSNSPSNASNKSMQDVVSLNNKSPKRSSKNYSSNSRSTKSGSQKSPTKITPKHSPEKLTSSEKRSQQSTFEEISSPKRSPTKLSPKLSPENSASQKTRSPTKMFEEKSSQKGSPTRVSRERGSESVREIMAPKKRVMDNDQARTNGRRSHPRRGHAEEESSNKKTPHSRRWRSEEKQTEEMSYHQMDRDKRGRFKSVDIRTSTSDGVVQVGVGVKGNERKRNRRPQSDVVDDVQVRTSASDNQVSVGVGLHHRKKKRPVAGLGDNGGGDEERDRGSVKTNRRTHNSSDQAMENGPRKHDRSPHKDEDCNEVKQQRNSHKDQIRNRGGRKQVEEDREEESGPKYFKFSSAQKVNGTRETKQNIKASRKKKTVIKTHIDRGNSPPKIDHPSTSPSGFLGFVNKVFHYLAPPGPNKRRCNRCGYARGHWRRSVQSVRPVAEEVSIKNQEYFKGKVEAERMRHGDMKCVEVNQGLPMKDGEENNGVKVINREQKKRYKEHSEKEYIKEHSSRYEKQHQQKLPVSKNVPTSGDRSSFTNKNSSWANEDLNFNATETRQQTRQVSPNYDSKRNKSLNEYNKKNNRNRSFDSSQEIEGREFASEAASNQPIQKASKLDRSGNMKYYRAHTVPEKSLKCVCEQLSSTRKVAQPNRGRENKSRDVSRKGDRIQTTSVSHENYLSTEKQHKSKTPIAAEGKGISTSQTNSKKHKIQTTKNSQLKDEPKVSDVNYLQKVLQPEKQKHEKISRKKNRSNLAKSKIYTDEKEEEDLDEGLSGDDFSESPREKWEDEMYSTSSIDDEARVPCGKSKRHHSRGKERVTETARKEKGKCVCHEKKVSTNMLNNIRHEAKQLGLVLPPKVDKFLSEMKHTLRNRQVQQEDRTRPSLTCFKKRRSKSAAPVGARCEYFSGKDSEHKMAGKSRSCLKCKTVAEKRNELEADVAQAANETSKDHFKEQIFSSKDDEEKTGKKLSAQNAALEGLGKDLLDVMRNDSRLLHNLDALCEAIQTGKPYKGIPRKKNEVQSVIRKESEERNTELNSSSEPKEVKKPAGYKPNQKKTSLSTVIECDICSVDMSPYKKKFARYLNNSYTDAPLSPTLLQIQKKDPSLSRVEEEKHNKADFELQSDGSESNSEWLIELPKPTSDQQEFCTQIFEDGHQKRIHEPSHRTTKILTCFVPDSSESHWEAESHCEETMQKKLNEQKFSSSDMGSCVVADGSLASSCEDVVNRDILVRAKKIYNRIVHDREVVGLQPDILYSTIVNKLLNMNSIRSKKQEAKDIRNVVTDHIMNPESKHSSIMSHRNPTSSPTQSSDDEKNYLSHNSSRQFKNIEEIGDKNESVKEITPERPSNVHKIHKRKVQLKPPKLSIDRDGLDKLCPDSLTKRRVRTEEVLLSKFDMPNLKQRKEPKDVLQPSQGNTTHGCQHSTDKQEILFREKENDNCEFAYTNYKHNYPNGKINKRKWIFDKYQDIPDIQCSYNTPSDFSTHEYDESEVSINVNFLTSAVGLRKRSEHLINAVPCQHQLIFEKNCEEETVLQQKQKLSQHRDEKIPNPHTRNNSSFSIAGNIKNLPSKQFECNVCDEESKKFSTSQLKPASGNLSNKSDNNISTGANTLVTGVKTMKKSYIPFKIYKFHDTRRKIATRFRSRLLESAKRRHDKYSDNTENSSCNDKVIETAESITEESTQNDNSEQGRKEHLHKHIISNELKQHLIENVKSLKPQRVIEYLVLDRALNREDSKSTKYSKQSTQRSKMCNKLQPKQDPKERKEYTQIDHHFLNTSYIKTDENKNCVAETNKNANQVKPCLEKICLRVGGNKTKGTAKKKKPTLEEVPAIDQFYSVATNESREEINSYLEKTFVQMGGDTLTSASREIKERNKSVVSGQSRPRTPAKVSNESKQSCTGIPKRKRPITVTQECSHFDQSTGISKQVKSVTPNDTHHKNVERTCIKHILKDRANDDVQQGYRISKNNVLSTFKKAGNLITTYMDCNDQESSTQQMNNSALSTPRKIRESRQSTPMPVVPPKSKRNVINAGNVDSRVKKQEIWRNPSPKKQLQKTRAHQSTLQPEIKRITSRRDSQLQRNSLHIAKRECLKKIQCDKTVIKSECKKRDYFKDKKISLPSEESRLQDTDNAMSCSLVVPHEVAMTHVDQTIENNPSSQTPKLRTNSPQPVVELCGTLTGGFKKSITTPISNPNDNIETKTTDMLRTEDTPRRKRPYQSFFMNKRATVVPTKTNQQRNLTDRPAFVTVVRAPKGEIVNKAYAHKLPRSKMFASHTKIVPSSIHRVVDARELTNKITQFEGKGIIKDVKQDVHLQQKFRMREKRVFDDKTRGTSQEKGISSTDRKQNDYPTHVQSCAQSPDTKEEHYNSCDNESESKIPVIFTQVMHRNVNEASRSSKFTKEHTFRNPVSTKMENCLQNSNKHRPKFQNRNDKNDYEECIFFRDENEHVESTANYSSRIGNKNVNSFFLDKQESDDVQDDTEEEVKNVCEYIAQESLTNCSRPRSKKIIKKNQDTKLVSKLPWQKRSSEVINNKSIPYNQLAQRNNVTKSPFVRKEVEEQNVCEPNFQRDPHHSSSQRFLSPRWAVSPHCLLENVTNVAEVSRSQERGTQQSMEKERQSNKMKMHIKVTIAEQSPTQQVGEEIDISLGYDSEQSNQLTDSQVLQPIGQSEQQIYLNNETVVFHKDFETGKTEILNDYDNYNKQVTNKVTTNCMGAIQKHRGQSYACDIEANSHEPFTKCDLNYGYVLVEDRNSVQDVVEEGSEISSSQFVNEETSKKCTVKKVKESKLMGENYHYHKGEIMDEPGKSGVPEHGFNIYNIDSTANLGTVSKYTKDNDDTKILSAKYDYDTYDSNSNEIDYCDVTNSEKSINNDEINSEYILHKPMHTTSVNALKCAPSDDSRKNLQGASSLSEEDTNTLMQSKQCVGPNNYTLDKRQKFHIMADDNYAETAKTASPLCFGDLYEDFVDEPILKQRTNSQIENDENGKGVPLMTPSSEYLLAYAVGSKKYHSHKAPLKQFYNTMQIPHGPSPSSVQVSRRSYEPHDAQEESSCDLPSTHDDIYHKPCKINFNDTCHLSDPGNDPYYEQSSTSASWPPTARALSSNGSFKDMSFISSPFKPQETNRTISKELNYNKQKNYKECVGTNSWRVGKSDSIESQENDLINHFISNKYNFLLQVKKQSQRNRRNQGRHFSSVDSIYNMAKQNVNVLSESDDTILETSGRINEKQEGPLVMGCTTPISKVANYTENPQCTRGRDIGKYPQSKIPRLKRILVGIKKNERLKKDPHCFYNEKYMKTHLQSDTPVEVRNSPPEIPCKSATKDTPQKTKRPKETKHQVRRDNSQTLMRLSGNSTVTVDQLRTFFEQPKEAVMQTGKILTQTHLKKGKTKEISREKSDVEKRQIKDKKKTIKSEDKINVKNSTSEIRDKKINVIKAPSSINETDSSYSSTCQLLEPSKVGNEIQGLSLSSIQDNKQQQSSIQMDNNSDRLISQATSVINNQLNEIILSDIKLSPSVQLEQQQQRSIMHVTDCQKVDSSNRKRKQTKNEQINSMIANTSQERAIGQERDAIDAVCNDKSKNDKIIQETCDPIPQLLKLLTRNMDGNDKGKDTMNKQVVEIVVTVDETGYKFVMKSPTEDASSSVGLQEKHDVKFSEREVCANAVDLDRTSAVIKCETSTLKEEHIAENNEKTPKIITLITESKDYSLGNLYSKDLLGKQEEMQEDTVPKKDSSNDASRSNIICEEPVESLEVLVTEGRNPVNISNSGGLSNFQQTSCDNGVLGAMDTSNHKQQVSTESSSEESRHSMVVRTLSCLDKPWSVANVSFQEKDYFRMPPIHSATQLGQNYSSSSLVKNHKTQFPQREGMQITPSNVYLTTQSSDSTTSSSIQQENSTSQVKFDPSRDQNLFYEKSRTSQNSFPMVKKSSKSLSFSSSHSFIDSGTPSHSTSSTESDICLQNMLSKKQEKKCQSNSSTGQLVRNKETMLVNVTQSNTCKSSPFLGSHPSAESSIPKPDSSRRQYQQASREQAVNREEIRSSIGKVIGDDESSTHMISNKQNLDIGEIESAESLIENNEKLSVSNIKNKVSCASFTLRDQVSNVSFKFKKSKTDASRRPYEAISMKREADELSLSANRRIEERQQPQKMLRSEQHGEIKRDIDDEDDGQCKDILSLLYKKDSQVFEDAIAGMGVKDAGGWKPGERSSTERLTRKWKKKTGKTAINTSPPGVPARMMKSKKDERKGGHSNSHNILSQVGRWFGKKKDKI